MTDVAVVVPNYNGGAFLSECLHALIAQTAPPAEIVVVDNGSADGSRELVEQRFPTVAVVALGTNTGFATAANRGVAATSAPLVAVLNSDTIVDRRWLERLLSGPHADDIWSWGSVLVDPAGTTVESAGDLCNLHAMASKYLKGASIADVPGEPYDVFAAPGAAPLFRRDVFERLGGYEEKFFLYYEDIDLAFRAHLLGYRAVMVPGAHVRHRLGGSGSLARTRYYVARNSLWTAVRNLPRPGPRVLWQATRRGLADARRRGYVLTFLRGRLAGVIGLPWAFRTRREIQRAKTISDDEVRAMLLSRPGGHAVR